MKWLEKTSKLCQRRHFTGLSSYSVQISVQNYELQKLCRCMDGHIHGKVNFLVSLCGGFLDIMPLCSYFKLYTVCQIFIFQYYWNIILTNLCFYSIFVNLDQEYICSNSQKYMVWVKIIAFSFMPKIFRTLCKDHVPWRYFIDVLRISK